MREPKAAGQQGRFVGIKAVSLMTMAVLAGCAGPSTVSVSPSQAFDKKMRVAVLDLDWSPPTGTVQSGASMISAPNAGRYVADSLSARLLEIGCYDVLERSRLAQLLAEKSLTQAEIVRQGRYKEIGQVLGVDYVVAGTVNTYTSWTNGFLSGLVVSFNSRCIDVRTSQVVWGLDGRVDVGPFGPIDPARGLQQILDDAIPKLKRSIQSQTER